MNILPRWKKNNENIYNQSCKNRGGCFNMAMKITTLKIISIEDFCEHFHLDSNEVLDVLSHDDSVCYGTNYETVISVEHLIRILSESAIISGDDLTTMVEEANIPEDIFIGLGC